MYTSSTVKLCAVRDSQPRAHPIIASSEEGMAVRMSHSRNTFIVVLYVTERRMFCITGTYLSVDYGVLYTVHRCPPGFALRGGFLIFHVSLVGGISDFLDIRGVPMPVLRGVKEQHRPLAVCVHIITFVDM